MTNTKERTLESEAADLDDMLNDLIAESEDEREHNVADLVRRARAAGVPPESDLKDLVRLVNKGAIDPVGFEALIAWVEAL